MIANRLNQSVWCKLAPSKIHGIGVFAIRDIPKGTMLTNNDVWSQRRREVFHCDEQEFAKILPEIQDLITDRMFFEKGKPLYFISPNDDQVLQSFMNHSNTPNSDGEFALCDIKKGEEITEDFNTLTDDAHEITLKKYHLWN